MPGVKCMLQGSICVHYAGSSDHQCTAQCVQCAVQRAHRCTISVQGVVPTQAGGAELTLAKETGSGREWHLLDTPHSTLPPASCSSFFIWQILVWDSVCAYLSPCPFLYCLEIGTYVTVIYIEIWWSIEFVRGFAKNLIHDRAGGVSRASFEAKLVNE